MRDKKKEMSSIPYEYCTKYTRHQTELARKFDSTYTYIRSNVCTNISKVLAHYVWKTKLYLIPNIEEIRNVS